jgi:hypothetical protein
VSETFSVRWQVAHSKVRTSTPRSPAEIRANPILCLQTGHIGRSTMELELRITHHPPKQYALQYFPVCTMADSGAVFWRGSGHMPEPGQNI